MTKIKKARTSAVHQQLSDGEQLRGNKNSGKYKKFKNFRLCFYRY